MITEDVKAWHSKLCDMTQAEIVKLMEDEQIKADRSLSRSCAVSEFILKKTGEQVATGMMSVISIGTNGYWDMDVPHLVHSSALSDFIQAFDEGKYPQLEKR